MPEGSLPGLASQFIEALWQKMPVLIPVVLGKGCLLIQTPQSSHQQIILALFPTDI